MSYFATNSILGYALQLLCVAVSTLIYVPFVIFVMLGATNAINLTDGIDGLATSITTIIIATLYLVNSRKSSALIIQFRYIMPLLTSSNTL